MSNEGSDADDFNHRLAERRAKDMAAAIKKAMIEGARQIIERLQKNNIHLCIRLPDTWTGGMAGPEAHYQPVSIQEIEAILATTEPTDG